MLGHLMENEVREQPAVLQNGAATYAKGIRGYLAGRKFDMILLAARGSSDNAALFARYLIEVYLGIPVSLAAPSVLTQFGSRVKYQNCLAIGISQSGAAPDVAEVLSALREDGHATIAITNTEGSRLTSEAEATVLLGAGDEKSVAATKTFTASLLALYEVTRALGAALPEPHHLLPDDRWIETSRQAACETSGLVVRSSPVFALGRGYSFATAQETALKLMECALISCKSYSSADFEHGPKALAGHGSAAISYLGSLDELAKQGCSIAQAPRPPLQEHDHLALAPIWDIVFGQWLALQCARARGLDPDVPKHLNKVTKTL